MECLYEWAELTVRLPSQIMVWTVSNMSPTPESWRSAPCYAAAPSHVWKWSWMGLWLFRHPAQRVQGSRPPSVGSYTSQVRVRLSTVHSVKDPLNIMDCCLYRHTKDDYIVKVDETGLHCSPCKTCSIRRSKTTGALHRPKGITLNWHNSWQVLFCLISSSI